MELLHKVQAELEKKGHDFSHEFWTGEMLGVLHDIVYTTEKVLIGQEQAKEPEPMKTPTTYRECLEALPKGYRELAFKNAEEQGWHKAINQVFYCARIPEALNDCFLWFKTKQNDGFWRAVYNHYKIGDPLPELPNNE